MKWLEDNPLPKPSQQQVEWLEAEIGMFSHIGVNTYHNTEWSDGSLDPSCFNPYNLDCEQWIDVAEALGANYYVATAKHHDGFCLWPTNTTDYSVKSAPWKEGEGDVVGELAQACKRRGMKFGIYLSPWDRHEPCYKDKDAYDKFYLEQLEELLTWYDIDIFELWFDGAGSEGRTYDWESIMDLCKRYAPNAMIFNMGTPTIRWCGNEAGFAPYPNWYVISRENVDKFAWGSVDADGMGDYFIPAECDTPIRRFLWFHRKWSRLFLRSKRKLLEIYEKSVGRGSNLLLNLAPNREGLLDKTDAKRATWLGSEIEERYGRAISQTTGTGSDLNLDLDGPQTVNSVIIQEDIREGQRVRQYVLEYEQNGRWHHLLTGSSIGHKKIDNFRKINAEQLRLRFTKYWLEPIISNFSAY